MQYLLYHKRNDPQALSAISRLSLNIGRVLGGQAKLCKFFGVSPDLCLEDICDIIRNQWICYQSEEIPKEWVQQEASNKKSYKDSYWREVEAEWIGEVENEDFKNECIQVPIDQYWQHVGMMKKDDGKFKYQQLFALVKCCLAISHGNAAPERGFSINKHILQAHGTSLSENTLVALRRVKDSIMNHGGPLNIPITSDLLKSVENSYHKYSADIELQRQAQKDATKKKEMEEKEKASRKRKAGVSSQLDDINHEIQVKVLYV